MRILDISAGNRAIWFNKNHPDAVYIDVRPEVMPDIIADSRALPDNVGKNFDLVVFDPPHKNNGQNGNMTKNYGWHNAAEITSILQETAREAYRVTHPKSLMAFKWNDHTRKLSSAIKLLEPWWEPLVAHGVSQQQRSSSTSWVLLKRALDVPSTSSFGLAADPMNDNQPAADERRAG